MHTAFMVNCLYAFHVHLVLLFHFPFLAPYCVKKLHMKCGQTTIITFLKFLMQMINTEV